ncbi:MAG: hydrogenase maturation protease [Candidatus Bipolaricaulota bacterium]|nr:hydrogenase maturation protease [Candidatus Bipolaricaulota bacterium]
MDLVIGIGNLLRRDDGIGPRVAEALRVSPSVSACAVCELVPELVLRLRDARRVLFVDADARGTDVRLGRVRDEGSRWGHTLGPEGLLELAARAFGSAPDAWVLSVPGFDFGYGEGLSDRAEGFVPQAVERASRWLSEGQVSADGA